MSAVKGSVDQKQVNAPSTMKSEPVVKVEVSPARYTQMLSNSSGLPILPMGAMAFH